MLGIGLLRFLCWKGETFFSGEILSEKKNNSDLILLKKSLELRKNIISSSDYKIFVTTWNKQRLKGFQAKFLDEEILSKIEYITELPHWFRSFLKYLKRENLSWFFKYFQADKLVIWWWEIFTDEMKTTWIDLTISAFPFFLRKLFKKSEIFLTWGIQSPKSFLSKIIYKFWINNSKKIFLRDFKSFDDILSFSDNKETREKLCFMFDLSILFFSPQDIKEYYADKNKKKTSIVNLNPKGEKYFEEVLKEVESDLKNWYEVYYFPANILEDSKYFNEIKHKLESKQTDNFKLLDWDKNWGKFIEIFSQAEKAIGTRLHFYIICKYFNINIKPLPYQKKVEKIQKVVEIAIEKIINK